MINQVIFILFKLLLYSKFQYSCSDVSVGRCMNAIVCYIGPQLDKDKAWLHTGTKCSDCKACSAAAALCDTGKNYEIQ